MPAGPLQIIIGTAAAGVVGAGTGVGVIVIMVGEVGDGKEAFIHINQPP